MAGKNCKCHSIGKTMARTTRKSNMTSALQNVGGIAAGIGGGAVGVPKLVAMIYPEGKINPTIVNGAGSVGAFLLARKQKGILQSMLHGLSAGMAWNALSPMIGIGYVDSNSTSFLNNVAGDYFPSRQDPGTV